jgi:hypothetical protein
VLSCALVLALSATACAAPPVTKSTKSGPWSAADTWEGGKVPGAGACVLVRGGHTITYDAKSDDVIRGITVSGTLTFAPDKDTVLNVGLIKIQSGDEYSEEGFDCDHAVAESKGPRAALLVGTPDAPVAAGKTALIRLHHVEGMNKESCPAIVCCGGRMDFHGQPMSRTWVKLGKPAAKGDTQVTFAEAPQGWKAGDKLVLTATTRQIKTQKTFRPSVRDNTQTEERTVKAIAGAVVTLSEALAFDHKAEDGFAGEVANLSRNVIAESAAPDGVRGHTMYHKHSAGSIGYAEFRYLGKRDTLGRYALHFHLCGDTMRGSSVIGASIHDSHNRWITIHGTNYLVVRDCVGYHSIGHGYFLEDATEVYNVFDRNLALQACVGKPLPKQVLPFDPNDGAGFWWSNSHNTFTRNVAAECDEYGFRFEVVANKEFDPKLAVRTPDGGRAMIDVRTLPFVRFEDNEAHCHRRHAFNLGGLGIGSKGVDGVGPDEKHPFVIRNMKVWNSHWSFHAMAPSVLVDGYTMHDVEYGLWRQVYTRHAYKDIAMSKVSVQQDFASTGTRPKEGDYPKPLDPTDDLPPTTVITHTTKKDGKLIVRGTTADNGSVKRVVVNGAEAKATAANFAQWEVTLGTATELKAHAEDAAGNVEKTAHVAKVK